MRTRPLDERSGWAFALCVAIAKPPLVLLTRRRWLGGHHVPATGGCVLVANHISHLDPFTLAHFVYEQGRVVRFLAKAEIFAIPLLGRLARSAGQIPVHRLTPGAASSSVAAADAVRAGRCVVIYPEGTLTRQPDLWPMTGRTGAARVALASGAPVIPVAQWGVQDILPPYATRPRLLPRKQIAVSAGRPVDLDDLRGQPVTPEVLREATHRIMDDVTALLEAVRGEQAPAERYDPRRTGVRPTGNPHTAPERDPEQARDRRHR